jgi:hypothetical protein
MPSHIILVGSYATSVYTLHFDPVASSGPALTLTDKLDVGFHPSWLTRHPHVAADGNKVVFTGLEQSEGRVVVLRFDQNGRGEKLAEVSSEGADPCTEEVIRRSDGRYELVVGNVGPPI